MGAKEAAVKLLRVLIVQSRKKIQYQFGVIRSHEVEVTI